MRMKQRAKRLWAALRRGMALSVAVALVCSMALGASALEMDVLNEDTGLIETLEFDDDEYPVADIFDEEETPAEDEDPTEASDDTETADEELDDTEETTGDSEQETKEDSTEEKDTETTDDEEFTDDDFISTGMLDEEEGEGEVALYDVVELHGVAEAWYRNEGDKAGFYVDSAYTSPIANTTMQEFINNYCTSDAKVHLDSTYIVNADEKWEPYQNGTLELVQSSGCQAVNIGIATLTLEGKLTLDSESTAQAVNTPIVLNRSGSGLVIDNGVTIKGCKATGGISGIVHVNQGTFTMKGGTLSGGSVPDNAGGVYVNGGTFTMSGGKITGCTSTGGYGGGVFMGSGTFEMSSDALISDCKATYGGGVYMAGGTFNMSGGTIGDENGTTNGNLASGLGGGVYVAGGTFTMSQNATIAGNTGTGGGGGIYLGDNKAYGSLIMTGGKITGNKVTTEKRFGGGIGGYGDFTMSGGIITKNESYYSSGISKPSGKLEISGGTIANNKYEGSGTDEVSISNSTDLTITGGSVLGINTPDRKYIKDRKEHQLVQYPIKNFTSWSNYHFTITYILDGVEYTYDCGEDVYADDNGNVYLWLPQGSKIKSGTGNIPRISVTVPLTMLVTVSGDGTCGITTTKTGDEEISNIPITYAAEPSNGTITNNSNVPIYITDVTFTWNTEGGTTTNGDATPAPKEIFTDWSNGDGRPKIELEGYSRVESDGGNTITWTLNKKLDAEGGENPSLDLTWSFDLKNNSISQALQADTLAPIGTIVYTVSYQNPNPTSTQDDDFYIYEYENGGDAA